MHVWVPVPPQDDDDPRELFDEIAEHGVRVASVQRFYADGPTYAWADGTRLGAFADEGAARLAVMRALAKGRAATLEDLYDLFGEYPATGNDRNA